MSELNPPELEELIDAVEWAHTEHQVSFVQAGDDRIYAYGGDGFVVVISDKVFAGLVELESPSGSARIEPQGDGYAVTVAPEGASAPAILSSGAAGLRRYYTKRYWKV